MPPPFRDPAEPVDEYSAREYVLARGQIISHTDLASRPVHKSQTSWYHSDVRGSTIMLTGSNAQISAAYSYDAWGSVYGERPVVGVPRPVVPAVARPAVERGTEYLYTGKRFDPETGLADYGFRDYAASLARFTTMDPVRDGRNWFAYVEGDPVNKVDLWGLTAADTPADFRFDRFNRDAEFVDFQTLRRDSRERFDDVREILLFPNQMLEEYDPRQSRGGGYGPRTNPITGARLFHTGRDLTSDYATNRSVAIYAPLDGTVVEILNDDRVYGNSVVIESVEDSAVISLTAHLVGVDVSVGDRVVAGLTRIGTIGTDRPETESGTTGVSTGPHIHQEFQVDGHSVPYDVFNIATSRSYRHGRTQP